MKLDELEILEDDFDLFVALDDTSKIEFLFDAVEEGLEASAIKQVSKLADLYNSRPPIVSSEDYRVGNHRICVTSFPDMIHLNSTSISAIRKFVNKPIKNKLGKMWVAKQKRLNRRK